MLSTLYFILECKNFLAADGVKPFSLRYENLFLFKTMCKQKRKSSELFFLKLFFPCNACFLYIPSSLLSPHHSFNLHIFLLCANKQFLLLERNPDRHFLSCFPSFSTLSFLNVQLHSFLTFSLLSSLLFTFFLLSFWMLHCASGTVESFLWVGGWHCAMNHKDK